MISDLLIAATPPPTLGAALVLIGNGLHEAFAAQPNLKPEISLRSCILSSLAVRDFLRRAGFAAEVEPCLCFIEAYDIFGECLHTLGIGTDALKPAKSKTGWSGHMVVTVDGWLIDTTLFPAAKRPGRWEIPGMIATPMDPDTRPAFGLPGMARVHAVDPADGSYVRVRWLAQPHNKLWKRAPDIEPWRRFPVVNQLVAQWEALRHAAREDSLER